VLGISDATAKTYLQHIYSKTDTSKQTETHAPVHEFHTAGEGVTRLSGVSPPIMPPVAIRRSAPRYVPAHPP
jgi:hypothetical protein